MKFLYIFLITVGLVLTACSQQITTEEYISKGEKYFENKEWKSAIIEFKNAIRQSPDNAHVRALLGAAYLHTFSSNAAVKELKKSIELGVKDEKVMVQLGRGYEQLNQNDKIIEEITVAKSQSTSVQAEINAIRAKALLRSNQLVKAKKALDSAKSLDENSTDVRLAWAQYENTKKNEAAQRKWLAPLLERDGGVADAWSQLAAIEMKLNAADKAEAAYSRAISLRKIVHYDSVRRALLRISIKDYKRAQEDINVLKKAGASWPVVRYAEGLMAYQQAEYDKAHSLFEKVLSENANYSPAQLLFGFTNFHKANYQNAVTNLELYLAEFPKADQARFIYAASLLKLGRLKPAITVLEDLNKSQAEEFKVLSLLGNAYLLNNKRDLGLQLLQKVVKLNPTHAGARLQLGEALMRNRSTTAKAQQQLIKAIELDEKLFQADLALFSSYMREKKFSHARKVAKSLKQKQDKSTLGSNLVAISYFADSNKKAAVVELVDTLKLFPADPLTSDNLAKVYFQDDQLNKAKNLYLDVLKKHPQNLKTYNQLALISAKENDHKAVIEWLKKAVEHNPDNLSAKLLLANQYLFKNDSKLAIQLLQTVDEEDKKLPEYALLMAKAKISVGEYLHATRALRALLDKNAELNSARILLAQSYAHLNQKNKMREILEEALKRKPLNFPANIMLTKLALFERNYDDFRKRVAFLVENYPKNKDVQFLNAKIQSSEKGYEGAIKTLTEIMSDTPHSDVAIDLARNRWANGDKDGAISGLEIWLQGNEADKNALMVLAQFYLSENRIMEAKKTYQSLDAKLPDNAVILNNLAWLMKETDVNQGIIYAQKANKLQPNNPYIQDTLAMLLLAGGAPDQALTYSSQAAVSLPNILDIQINHSKILVANNKKTDARDLLNNLLKNERQVEVRKVIKQELNKL